MNYIRVLLVLKTGRDIELPFFRRVRARDGLVMGYELPQVGATSESEVRDSVVDLVRSRVQGDKTVWLWTDKNWYLSGSDSFKLYIAIVEVEKCHVVTEPEGCMLVQRTVYDYEPSDFRPLGPAYEWFESHFNNGSDDALWPAIRLNLLILPRLFNRARVSSEFTGQ